MVLVQGDRARESREAGAAARVFALFLTPRAGIRPARHAS
jgi:hypothetical protein